MPRRSCGRPASRPTRCSPTPTCRSTTRDACPARRISPSKGSPASSPPVTAPPSLTSRRTTRTRCAARARSTRCARPRCWPPTSSPHSRRRAARLQARLRGLGRLARPLPWRRRDLRDQAARLPGLVHAPHLSRLADAHVQPQGPHRRRLDRRVALPPRGGLARPAADARRPSSSRPLVAASSLRSPSQSSCEPSTYPNCCVGNSLLC